MSAAIVPVAHFICFENELKSGSVADAFGSLTGKNRRLIEKVEWPFLFFNDSGTAQAIRYRFRWDSQMKTTKGLRPAASPLRLNDCGTVRENKMLL